MDDQLFTAFGEQRVASPTSLLDISHEYDTNPLLWYEVSATGGNATFDANSHVKLNTTGTPGSRIQRQTKLRPKYQPSKSQKADLTFSFDGWQSGHNALVGYGDDSDGIFLRKRPDGVESILLRGYGSTVTEVLRDGWDNPLLRFKEALNCDLTKAQILSIDLQWLGVGDVRSAFSMDRVKRTFHRFEHKNALTAPYMATATLPILYEIENVSGNTPAFLRQICCAVSSEGGFESGRAMRNGFPGSVATKSVTTAWTPLVSVAGAQLFAGKANRIPRIMESFGVYTTGPVQFGIWYNPALTGATWASVVPASSSWIVDTAATVMSGGFLIQHDMVATGGGSGRAALTPTARSAWPLGRLGSQFDHYTLAARTLTGSETCTGFVNCAEFR